jgi:K+-sensing histidine kinase KdpD
MAGYSENGDIKLVRDLITINIMILITAFMVGRKHTIILTSFLLSAYFLMSFFFRVTVFSDYLIFLSLFTLAALFIYSLLANLIEKTVKASMDAKVEIEQLSKFKHNIIRLVFHDLKVPVNSIIDLNLKENTSKSEKTVFYARIIKKQLENVLDVEKLEEAEMKPEFRDFSVREIIFNAINSIEVLANQKNIKIKTSFYSEGLLTCDRNLIERVFINLLSNAVKYSDLNKDILIIVESNYNFCKITVEDNGIGISTEHMDKIFNKYYMINTNNSSSGGSTGLGLTFCKLAVAAHKGNIEVKSIKESGSAFIVNIPGYKINELHENQTSFTNEVFILEQKDQAQLKTLCETIKNIPLFKIGEIIPLIKTYENNPQEKIRLWVNQLSNAVYNGNTQHYNQLINLVLYDN